jgi:glyoxylase-like metal-dependent hydrolase (beta-lactamase superfamily II)
MNEHKIIKNNGTNYFLLKANEGYLLIDSGWNGQLKSFLKKIGKAGIDLNEIKYIMVTHHHHDHAALVSDLRKITHAQLIVHKKQVKLLQKGDTDTSKIKQFNVLLWLLDLILKPFIRLSYPPIEIKADDFIIGNDGRDILNAIGIQGRLVETPGHSEDSITLVLDNGNAYCGDAFMNIFGIRPYPIEAEDYIAVKESWRKIVGSKAKFLYPSHGKEFSVKTLA